MQANHDDESNDGILFSEYEHDYFFLFILKINSLLIVIILEKFILYFISRMSQLIIFFSE